MVGIVSAFKTKTVSTLVQFGKFTNGLITLSPNKDVAHNSMNLTQSNKTSKATHAISQNVLGSLWDGAFHAS